jgi:hypothetical protein
MLRAIALLLLVAFAAAPASAQQHWLQGKWSGTLTNQPMNSRTGPERTLDVKSVSADGTSAQAEWINSASTSKITITISGNDITFTTPGSSGSNYKLKHNAGVLSGDWQPAGGGTRGGSVNLKKQ